MRRSLSTTARVRIFDAAEGKCSICGVKIMAGERWEVSHETPIALGGADAPHNMRPVHAVCHRKQTSEIDIPAIAKAKRMYAKHIGATQPKSKPMAGSRKSPWKHTFRNGWERRHP